MEKTIFHKPEVLRELQKYVEVRLHTDLADEKSRALNDLKEKRLNDISLPIYEIVDPETGKALEVFKGADLISGGANFRKFLNRNAP